MGQEIQTYHIDNAGTKAQVHLLRYVGGSFLLINGLGFSKDGLVARFPPGYFRVSRPRCHLRDCYWRAGGARHEQGHSAHGSLRAGPGVDSVVCERANDNIRLIVQEGSPRNRIR
jgi:hypothetical protein